MQRHYWRLQFHLVVISYPLKNISRLRKFFNIGIFICFIISHLGLYYFYELQVLDKLIDHFFDSSMQ